RGVAAAEIVHEDANAEPIQLAERPQRHIDVLDEEILRDFQRQPLGLEAECLEDLCDLAHEAALRELPHREVYPHRLRRIVAVLAPPDLALPTRLLEHPPADVADEARLLGDVDELT